MEGSRRAQEQVGTDWGYGRGQGGYPLTFWHPILLQLLWDLELLIGAGLGLLWPPRAQFCNLRAPAQCARSQPSESGGRVGGDSEQLMSGVSRAWLRQGDHCDIGAIVVVRGVGGVWALDLVQISVLTWCGL